MPLVKKYFAYKNVLFRGNVDQEVGWNAFWNQNLYYLMIGFDKIKNNYIKIGNNIKKKNFSLCKDNRNFMGHFLKRFFAKIELSHHP